MDKLFLILDAPYLCHRARYSMPQDLTYGGNPTAIIYAFLKEIVALQEQFRTSRLLFCWDSRSSKRKAIYPQYKANRHSKELTEEEIAFERAFRHQMKKLRTEYLPEIGYRNIYRMKGYESDDLIAKLSASIANEDNHAVVVSSDHDLYQVISAHVSFYNPHDRKELTLQGFKKQFGIVPLDWIRVKAIAGCSTDNVEGIRGVGEKTAIKYIRNELKPTTKAFQAIKSGEEVIDRNLPLVCLPFPDCPHLEIKKDKLSISDWKSVCKKLGFKSISDTFNPFPMEKIHR